MIATNLQLAQKKEAWFWSNFYVILNVKFFQQNTFYADVFFLRSSNMYKFFYWLIYHLSFSSSGGTCVSGCTVYVEQPRAYITDLTPATGYDVIAEPFSRVSATVRVYGAPYQGVWTTRAN